MTPFMRKSMRYRTIKTTLSAAFVRRGRLLAIDHSAREIGVDVDADAARVKADVCRLGCEAAIMLGVGSRWMMHVRRSSQTGVVPATA